MAASSGVGNLAPAIATIISHVSILLLEQTGDCTDSTFLYMF